MGLCPRRLSWTDIVPKIVSLPTNIGPNSDLGERQIFSQSAFFETSMSEVFCRLESLTSVLMKIPAFNRQPIFFFFLHDTQGWIHVLFFLSRQKTSSITHSLTGLPDTSQFPGHIWLRLKLA